MAEAKSYRRDSRKKKDLFLSDTILRIFLAGMFFLSIYGIIIVRLWEMQVKEGEEHRQKISRQSIRTIRHPAVRGRIFSSDSHLMADNKASFNLVFHISEMRQPGKQTKTIDFILDSARKLASDMGREVNFTRQDISQHMNMRPGLPMTIFKNLTEKELALALETTPVIPGMEVESVPLRFYPESRTASHLLGYTGQGDPKQAEDRTDYFYYIPDIVGRSGVEGLYDTEIPESKGRVSGLRGSPGNSKLRVDHLGYIYETLDSSPPKTGNDIILTVDWEAQKIAEKLFDGKKGSFILLNAETGAVLAMLSSPSFDPNIFVPKITSKDWSELQEDKDKPLLNRAIMGSYTPGSIIKPLIALSLLEHGFNPMDAIFCDGGTQIGNAHVKCWSWKYGGHGRVNMWNALEQSCNDFFIEKGRRLGLASISDTLTSANIGRETGFPMFETKGLLPSKEDKMRIFKEKWNDYDTSILSIGQGIILVSPLQAVSYTAAIANGGTLWKPHVLKEVRDPHGNTIFVNQPAMSGKLKASQSSIEVVAKGMWMVVNSERGSAKTARNRKIELSGKTGSAEMGPRNDRYVNAWFICFGKQKDNLYAAVVFVEQGDSGGRTCAPVAKDFFNQWFEATAQAAKEKEKEKEKKKTGEAGESDETIPDVEPVG